MTFAKRVTVQALQGMKQAGETIAMLTAYDFFTARLLDKAGVDVLLATAIGPQPEVIIERFGREVAALSG
jgi:hypothetical protein